MKTLLSLAFIATLVGLVFYAATPEPEATPADWVITQAPARDVLTAADASATWDGSVVTVTNHTTENWSNCYAMIAADAAYWSSFKKPVFVGDSNSFPTAPAYYKNDNGRLHRGPFPVGSQFAIHCDQARIGPFELGGGVR